MEHDLPMILVSVGSSLVVGVLSSYLTFRLQFESHRAMDAQREKDWLLWRQAITKDVEILKAAAGQPVLATIMQQMKDVERRLGSIEEKLMAHWGKP